MYDSVLPLAIQGRNCRTQTIYVKTKPLILEMTLLSEKTMCVMCDGLVYLSHVPCSLWLVSWILQPVEPSESEMFTLLYSI